ncbi:MAG TPA: hypothetical protein VFP06_05960 [Acidimicrobiales bacterium]|nr:hypothetical protein [Acidimicrobiales bacterium]
MSLPPDPHDDDLAEPLAPPPPAPGDAPAAAPEPPPSPAYAPRPAPTIGGPVASTPTSLPPVPPAVPPPPAAPDSATGSAGQPGPGPGRLGATTPERQGPGEAATPGDARGGRARLGLMLAGVVAVIAVAGGIVVATGDGDDAAAPADAEATAGDDEGSPPDAGPATSGPDEAETTADAGAAPAGDTSPVELAEEFFAAVAGGDCAAMIERMTPESYSAEGQTAAEAVAECEADESGTAAVAAAEFDDVELVSDEGDTAVVRVTVTVDRVTRTAEMPLRRVDGRWLMDLDTAQLATPG